MAIPGRLRPLDVVAVAVALVVVAYGAARLRGSGWDGHTKAGAPRPELTEVTLMVTGQPLLRLTLEHLAVGALVVETARGVASVEVLEVRAESDHGTVVVKLAAEIAEDGRVFWDDRRLRLGEILVFGDRLSVYSGRVLAIRPLPAGGEG